MPAATANVAAPCFHDQHRGECAPHGHDHQQAGFFRGVEQPQGEADTQGPAKMACSQVMVGAEEYRSREKDKGDFLHVIAAVVGQSVGGHYPEHGLRDLLNGRRAVEPEDGKGQVVEGGTMVLEGVIGVGAVFQQFACLNGLVCFVAVHGAVPQIVEAEKGGSAEDEKQQENVDGTQYVQVVPIKT